MNIGYACLNNSIPFNMKTFRLTSYSEELLQSVIEHNLLYTMECLKFNAAHHIGFYRFSSDIIPFASHPINSFNWQKTYKNAFKEMGDFVRTHGMRTSFHPDQFVVLNSKSLSVVQNAIKELQYHTDMYSLMELDICHKIQIHVGGVFDDKHASMERFIAVATNLPTSIKDRLVIENDDRLYSLKDCMYINQSTSIPILFDNFHHQCLNNGEPMENAFTLACSTWKECDGKPMMDYSSQQDGKRTGAHAVTIDVDDFIKYKDLYIRYDIDVILEIKDKEASVRKAMAILESTH